MNIKINIDIDAPVETVWHCITDIEQIKRWLSDDIIGVDPADPGPLHAGQKSRMQIKEGGRIAEYENEIIQCNELEQLELLMKGQSLGKNPMMMNYHLTPSNGRTSLQYVATWKPHGLFLWLMSPLISWLGRRNTAKAFTRLKALAEDPARDKSVEIKNN
ncbi:MAG: SRPBCC family protein [Pirellulaceae bacterium]